LVKSKRLSGSVDVGGRHFGADANNKPVCFCRRVFCGLATATRKFVFMQLRRMLQTLGPRGEWEIMSLAANQNVTPPFQLFKDLKI